MTNQDKRKRIKESLPLLNSHYRKEFYVHHWDILNNRLYSHNYEFALEWMECNQPNSPETYENQNARGGIVRFVDVSFSQK